MIWKCDVTETGWNTELIQKSDVIWSYPRPQAGFMQARNKYVMLNHWNLKINYYYSINYINLVETIGL